MRPLKIAIASSGLGHVARGIETWAEELGIALHEHGADVGLFKGGGVAGNAWTHVVPCFQRDRAGAQRIASVFRNVGGWRYGMGSACDVEQTTFSVGLWRRIRHDYDILHVQEHRIGLPLQYLRAKGLSKPKVILGNGTGEPADVLRKFQYLQQLSPEYTEAWEAQKTPSQSVFTIPNFIDASQFVPGDRAGARRSLNLPEDRLIFLCVSAIRATHKRIDCLLKEFAEFAKQSTASPLLVIAGATDPDSAALIEYGKSLLGDNVVFLANVPRSNMQLLYQAADVFVISSLFEMFGIAIVEAMASGIPVICNDTATFRWVVGPAGLTADISGDGGLSRLFAAVADRNVRGSLAAQARSHVLANFSVEAVVPEMLKMYSSVASSI